MLEEKKCISIFQPDKKIALIGSIIRFGQFRAGRDSTRSFSFVRSSIHMVRISEVRRFFSQSPCQFSLSASAQLPALFCSRNFQQSRHMAHLYKIDHHPSDLLVVVDPQTSTRGGAIKSEIIVSPSSIMVIRVNFLLFNHLPSPLLRLSVKTGLLLLHRFVERAFNCNSLAPREITFNYALFD